MATIHSGPFRADAPAGTVLFLIGMRLNRPWKVSRWLPAFAAMPRMLAELRRQPERGLLGARIWAGRTMLVVQYWRSMDDLLAYSRASDAQHLPAWRAFNRRTAKGAGDIGIWHETYVLQAGAQRALYRDMPAFGLAAATSHRPTRAHRPVTATAPPGLAPRRVMPHRPRAG